METGCGSVAESFEVKEETSTELWRENVASQRVRRVYPGVSHVQKKYMSSWSCMEKECLSVAKIAEPGDVQYEEPAQKIPTARWTESSARCIQVLIHMQKFSGRRERRERCTTVEITVNSGGSWDKETVSPDGIQETV
ncbi:hypothetical protein QAD02_015325 [Eretmocerus hayati]|uniref:Uncharacterized protein n=1 Tax=Eretmocerus hayati TaxID=131215 RepID=A0ACC2P7Y5_9HYME|nr:hypothetical protein QAD02_015325 [Eretmocerus hayati]